MDDLTEAQLSHEIYLNKLSSFYANQFQLIQSPLITAIRLVLSEFDEVTTRADVSEINARIDEEVTPILEAFVEEQEQAINELAEQEAEFQQDIFEAAGIGALLGLVAGISSTSLSKYNNSVALVGTQGNAVNVKKKLGDYPKLTVDQIKNFILAGYNEGQSIEDIRKAITGTAKNKYSDGYIATAKRNAESVIKTNRKLMESIVKTSSFKKAGTDGYILTAVLDGRTSDICLGYNGTIVLWTQQLQPKPPFHYNCRTTMTPYIKGTTEIPQGGFEWLKNQSANFQNDLIGPTRGDLLRNSGLTSEEYRKASRNNLNEPLTLAEMARKNDEIKRRLREKDSGV